MSVSSLTEHNTLTDWAMIRDEFPILRRLVNKHPLVYLDNAASSQKPQEVIDSIIEYYTTYNANVHRGVHTLSQEGTEAFERGREEVRKFLHAASSDEVLFTRGTTSAINTVAYTFGHAFLREGDEVLISALEHHSNIVPWQIICERQKAVLKIIPINERGEIIREAYSALLSDRTRLVSLAWISNALGTINPVKEMIAEAHAAGIPVLIDGAQAVPHMPVDVQDLDCDFFAFSGHKMYAPTGIGVLYGKKQWLEQLPPFEGGGEMIREVTFAHTTYNDLPFRFEAGTPHIEGVIGLGAAIRFMHRVGILQMQQRENELLALATSRLVNEVQNVRLIGTAEQKASVLSFLVGDIHPYDMGVILDKLGVAVRTGHHCTQPLMDFYGIPGTVRASFACYNNEEDVDRLIAGVKKAAEMLS